MERISSFSIDHDKLQKGMYISRTDFDDIITYDIRMKRPNMDDYVPNGAAHTFEHLFATYVRNSRIKDHVVYAGPMGCRTGFYFLTKNLPHVDALDVTREAMAFILSFTGDIPGATAVECGNYREQDLEGAKTIAADMLDVLKDWTEDDMHY